METFNVVVALIGIVVIVSSLLSGAIERSGVPLVAVFLGLGLLLGPIGLGLVDIRFGSPELHAVSTLALAMVLFSDAVTFETSALRQRRPLLIRLIGPGTLIPAVLVGAAAYFLLGVPLAAAAILGAALASTDPVLLRSVLRSRSVPEGTRMALRMETGMNDIVLLPIVVVAILFLRTPEAAGGHESLSLSRSLLGLFLLGPALGALVGWVGISLLSFIRDRWGVRRDYESMYALGLAFSAFAAAEAVGGSGFVAAFTAGLLVAAQDVELCDCFLEYGEATAEMMLLLTFVALGTTLIWTGLDVVEPRTLLFAGIALAARTVVLYPMLKGCGVEAGDRRLIALLGPRGLSSLLLALLPVFAGIPGAEHLFSITCLVVLVSVVVHGTGIAFYFRRHRPAEDAKPLAIVEEEPAQASTPDRITLGELAAMQERGDPVTIVDARSDRTWRTDRRTAAGAVRLDPEQPVRDATRLRLAKHGTLVVYCA